MSYRSRHVVLCDLRYDAECHSLTQADKGPMGTTRMLARQDAVRLGWHLYGPTHKHSCPSCWSRRADQRLHQPAGS